MSWELPRYEEIDMNAEVGAYQDDFDGDPLHVRKNYTVTGMSSEEVLCTCCTMASKPTAP